MLHQEKIKSKILRISLVFPVFFSAFLSCKSYDDNKDCFRKKINDIQSEQLVIELKNNLKDSIYKWSSLNLKNTVMYKTENSDWNIDVLLFNKNQTKVFGWILQVDKQALIDTIKNEDVLDYVEYFSGEKRGGNWFFYLNEMPSIFFAREDNNYKPYTFEQLSNTAFDKAVKGGLFDNSCNLSEKYINGWIDRDGRNMHKRYLEFLGSANID